MLSLVTRMLSTPVALSTTVTVPLATFSPSMEAVMVALPRLSAVRVAVRPSPSTVTTLFSLLVQVTVGSLLPLDELVLPVFKVAVAVSPTTISGVEKSIL